MHESAVSDRVKAIVWVTGIGEGALGEYLLPYWRERVEVCKRRV